MQILYIYLAFVNIVSFLIFGFDKMQAVKNRYRIPEKTLLIWSAIGGATGSFIGMHVFRHKTRKSKFFITVPILMIIQIILIILIVLFSFRQDLPIF